MRIYLLLGLILALVGSAFAADRGQSKFSTDAEHTAKNRRHEILVEIKTLENHQWAGDYYAGDGLGVNQSLVISPKSGWEYEWHGCLGLYDRNWGAVSWADGRIRLSFTFNNSSEGFRGISPELIPVTWGARHYLVPADDFIGFINQINEGLEPRGSEHGSFLLRRGDEKVKVSGLPKVPDEYQGYLLREPIEATIIEVGTSTTRTGVADLEFKETPITLDVGAQQGLRVGMELVVTKPNNMFESARITKVAETRSEAVILQIGKEDPQPKAGWRLSTRLSWHGQRTE